LINSVVKSIFFNHDCYLKLRLEVFILSRVLESDPCICVILIYPLYIGISQSNINRLYTQMVKNAAAILLTCTLKFDHIKPVLCSLHWLLVCYRIDFKGPLTWGYFIIL